jgi:two-component system, NtrC family, response regulator HydG
MAVFKRYSWPGNIRELENVIEHCFILESTNTLTLSSIPENVLHAVGVQLAAAGSATQSLGSPQLSDEVKAQPESKLDSVETVDGAEMAAGASPDDEQEGDLETDSEVDGDDGQLTVSIGGDTLDFNKHKEAFEREFIVKALKTFKGRINQTALHANIPKKTLLRKIEKYGIVARDFADPK